MDYYKHLGLLPWNQYSVKLERRILRPRAMGILTNEEEKKEEMRLLTSCEGSVDDGYYIKLYVLVDTSDGVIADAKYQAFGESALIGALEALCDLLIRKTYHQADRITADLIDMHFRDKSQVEAFPKEANGHINLVLNALDKIVVQCLDIPLLDEYTATPLDLKNLSSGEYPDWEAMSQKERFDTIHHLIEEEVQPYVQLDEGKVNVKELTGLELKIGYEGSCTTCYSSTGSTLSAIQQILRAKIHPQIVVIADLPDSH